MASVASAGIADTVVTTAMTVIRVRQALRASVEPDRQARPVRRVLALEIPVPPDRAAPLVLASDQPDRQDRRVPLERRVRDPRVLRDRPDQTEDRRDQPVLDREA